MVERKIEKLALGPAILEDKTKTAKAIVQIEAGWRAARHKINERAARASSGMPPKAKVA